MVFFVALPSAVNFAGATSTYQPRQETHNCRSIAVCFFGLTRSLPHTYASIQRNLLSRIVQQGFNYDLFLHTYNLTSLNNPRTNEINVPLDPNAWQMLEPLRASVDDPAVADARYNLTYFSSFGNAWPEDPSYRTLRNLLHQQYSIQSCFNLITQYISESGKHYSYLMFARPDVMYHRPGLPQLDVLPLTNETIAVKFIDRFAIGRFFPVKVWTERMASADELLRRPNATLHSETLVLHHLRRCKIRHFELDNFCFFRVRANGVNWPDCRNFLPNPLA